MLAFVTSDGQAVTVEDDERISTMPAGAEHASSARLRYPSSRRFRLVVNDQAGQGRAPVLADTLLRPLMKLAGVEERDDSETAILLGGDGTVHDHLNRSDARAQLVVVPCGTANALYASLFPAATTILSSFLAALRGDNPRPLSLARVNGRTVASVIVSSCLHASILHDSEALRVSHPGIERFKLAAAQNMTRRYSGHLRLRGHVRYYRPSTRSFASVASLDFIGPFSYALLAALTDRLEPTFVVTPLRHRDASPGLDVLLIRPANAPKALDPQSFAERVLGPVTAAMYDGGKHVDLVYDGDAVRPYTEGDEEQPNVVDYLRCDRVEWTPMAGNDEDVRHRLLCIDGALETILAGTSAVIEAVSPDEAPRVFA